MKPSNHIGFNRCVTGSYDRTARIWNVDTGDEIHALQGHENGVFSVKFNYPKCDQVATGSFDKTAKIWNVTNGACIQTCYGHAGEVVGVDFSPVGATILATASMDSTARVFHIETGQETHLFDRHRAEVIAVHFNNDDNILLTGSFDHNAYLWDLRTKEYDFVISESALN